MSAKGFISSLLVTLAALPLAANAKAKAAPARHGKVVLVGLTGPEDAARLTAPYRHAVIMQRTGRLEAVAIVIYGKAVRGLTRTGAPEELDALIRDAHAAGIPIYVCEHALKKAGIAPADVRPEATLVPSGAAKIAELVSEGFSPLQY